MRKSRKSEVVGRSSGPAQNKKRKVNILTYLRLFKIAHVLKSVKFRAEARFLASFHSPEPLSGLSFGQILRDSMAPGSPSRRRPQAPVALQTCCHRPCGSSQAQGYLAAMGVPITVPITSPETTISTRRFCCRPPAVSFEATGCVLPKPFAVTELAAIPCRVR